MSPQTTIKVSPKLGRALEGLKPQVMTAAIARGMRRGTLLIAGKVQAERLSGKGPFPVSQQKLGVVTGRLRQSVRSTEPEIAGNTVRTSIGSNVRYAAAHEFGFKGKVKVRAHEVTMNKLFGRKLAEPLRFSRLASQRNVNIPERRPFREGIEANVKLLEREVAREVTSEFKAS